MHTQTNSASAKRSSKAGEPTNPFGIRFLKHAVASPHGKARVRYSAHLHVSRNLPCVTLYARDSDSALRRVFMDYAANSTGVVYENNSRMEEDYFENGQVRIFEGDALYAQAYARATAAQAGAQS